MCEARVYLHDSKDENLLMRDVVRIEREAPDSSTMVIAALFGEQKLVDGRIVAIDFLQHTVVIEPAVEA